MSSPGRAGHPLPRFRRPQDLAGWAPYAVAVTVLSAALGGYGVDPGATPSLVLVVWFLLLTGPGEIALRTPRGAGSGGTTWVSWVPALLAGVAGFGLFLEPFQPLPFLVKNDLLALLSALLAWALAPGSRAPEGRR